MAPKKTIIRYYTVSATKISDSSSVKVKQHFWDALFAALEAYGSMAISVGHMDYEEGVQTNPSSTRKALYIGKHRGGSDMPWVSTSGDIRAITLETGEQIVEPAVIYPVPNSPKGVIGVFRTGGAAHPSAIESILEQLDQAFNFGHKEYELVPLFGENAEQLLTDSSISSKVTFKLESGYYGDTDLGGDPLSNGLREVYDEIGRGEATVTMEVSFGNMKLDHDRGLMEPLRKVIHSSAAKVAEATIRTRNDDGKEVRATIDFIKDRITEQVPLVEQRNIVDVETIFKALDTAETKLMEKTRQEPRRVEI